MKKLFVLLMILCLMIPCAHADKLEDFIAKYSEIAALYSAPDISTATEKMAYGSKVYQFSSGVYLIIIRNAKQDMEGVVVLGDEKCAGDMLAAIVCTIVAFDQEENIDIIFQRVMSLYLDYRDHKKDFSYSYVTDKGKIGVTMEFTSSRYQTIIGHTGL